MVTYDYIFERNGGLLKKRAAKKTHCPEYYVWRDGAREKLLKTAHEEFSIWFSPKNGKGLRLSGYYYPAGKNPGKKIAFLMHGFRSEHAETAGVWLDFYRSRGFDLFCPDNPAAGNSQGKHIGFGYYESLAGLEWLKFLNKKFGSDTRIILHGFSMGGTSVIHMGDRITPNVRFIIDDCGFTSAADILRPQLGVFYEPIRFINKIKGGYDLRLTDTRPHIRNTKVPMLFVHGKLDHTVPFHMGQELYCNYIPEKDFLFVDGAHHMESYWLKKKEYENKIDSFIAKYL